MVDDRRRKAALGAEARQPEEQLIPRRTRMSSRKTLCNSTWTVMLNCRQGAEIRLFRHLVLSWQIMFVSKHCTWLKLQTSTHAHAFQVMHTYICCFFLKKKYFSYVHMHLMLHIINVSPTSVTVFVSRMITTLSTIMMSPPSWKSQTEKNNWNMILSTCRLIFCLLCSPNSREPLNISKPM